MTRGSLNFREAVSDFSIGRCSRFHRLSPKGEEIEKYDVDEKDVKAMIQVSKRYFYIQQSTPMIDSKGTKNVAY